MSSDEPTNQDELVSQFLAVTGISDVDRATNYLEMSGGSLDTAVALFLEHGGGAATSSAAGATNPMMPPDEDDVRAPDATQTMRLMDNPMMGGGGFAPFAPMMGMMHDPEEENAVLMSSAFAASHAAAARDVINQHAAAAMRRHSGGSAADMDDDEDDDEDEYEYDMEEDGEQKRPEPSQVTLQDMFAPPKHLMHSSGGFQGARSVAKDSRRWLLVNLQCDGEFACHALNRDVWRDELVENLVREGFIFWQAMDVSNDGRTYAERYQVREYPHVAILDPRTGRLIWRKEGWTQVNPLTAMDFAEMAMDFCSRHSFDKPPVAASDNKKKRPILTEQEQLQEAVRASLKKGGDSEEEDDDVEFLGTSKGETKGPSDSAQVQEEETSKEPTALDEWLALEVGEEPTDGARIQIRMHDAKRLVRKFSPDSPVKTIYAFVAQSNDEAKGGREFLLKAGFPPTDLMESINNTIESCGLAGQAITVRWKE